MAGENTFTSLNANFKQVYADNIKNLIPDGVRLVEAIPFEERSKLGNEYNCPVLLQLEHGITLAGPDEDAVSLNAPISGELKNAKVKGSGLYLRSQIGYKAAMAGASSQAAFIDSTKLVVENMVRSMAKKLEIIMLYGQSGLGEVQTGVTVTTGGNPITLKEGEFAPGIWSAGRNMAIDVFTGNTFTGTVIVVSCNLETRVLTLKTAAGSVVVTANDTLWFQGARTASVFKEMRGIHNVLTYTGTDLFGIDTTAFELFQAPQYPTAGAISMKKINEAISLGVAKGLDSDVTVFLSLKAWDVLMSDQAALRKYDQSYDSREAKNGFKAIEFYSKNGVVSIVPSIHVKNGYAYILDLETWQRVGASDITFKDPSRGDEFFFNVPEKTAVELRAMVDCALMCSKPGHNVIMTGITYV